MKYTINKPVVFKCECIYRTICKKRIELVRGTN